jgi:hypothetical protein
MKRITLTQGKYANVDDCDYTWLLQWKWHSSRQGGSHYAERSQSSGVPRTVRMHRVIVRRMGLQCARLQVDHRALNGLNNTRSNLRLASPSDNKANAKHRKDNSSGYKGVSWCRRELRWRAYIHVSGLFISLGYFSSAKAAVIAYDNAAIYHFGAFACLNTP